MPRRTARRWPLALATVGLVLLGLAACAEIKPFDPPSYRENPPGPGIFSGKSGEFVILSR